MIIYDLIQRASTEDVLNSIKLYYGTKHINEIKDFLINLKNTKLQVCELVLMITINAYKEVDDEVEYLETFDENDPNVIYDVIAYDNNSDELYSIEASKAEDFLNYKISTETEKKYSETAILAHCLWDITAFLFNE
ncbi:MAG: hypothetical protein K2H29_05780 [Oscillospiraceae bacterium]|nr:hypothetical protein [Oscillospiraceae bacterium]